MRIALILNDDFSMWQFRGGLIRSLVADGHDVTLVVPAGDYLGALEDLGAEVVIVPMERFISPLRDAVLLVRLTRLFRERRFDVIHTITVKPNIFGTFAARLASCPRVVGHVCGAGYLFVEPTSARQRLVQWVGHTLYRLAFRFTDRCWFENPDDFEEFVRRGIVRPEQGVVILGGGIDTERFRPDAVPAAEIDALRKELNLPPDAKCVLMVSARLVWSKGVREFLAAAESAAGRWPSWFFVLVAPWDPEAPDAVPSAVLEGLEGTNTRVLTRFQDRIERFFGLADIVVLPSTYREGVPTVLLEGMAMGLPVITTDRPGCREAVVEGQNGYLIEAGNAGQLEDRLGDLIEDEKRRVAFGEAGVRLASGRFSDEAVAERVKRELYAVAGGE